MPRNKKQGIALPIQMPLFKKTSTPIHVNAPPMGAKSITVISLVKGPMKLEAREAVCAFRAVVTGAEKWAMPGLRAAPGSIPEGSPRSAA